MDKKNIVLVDGTIQAIVSLSNFLEFQGFRAFEAYNKDEAKSLIKEKDPVCVLIDPILEGAKEIMSVFPKKSFIVLYRLGDEPVKAKNIIGSILKPIDNEEVLTLIKKI